MVGTPVENFERKAPLVDLDELREMVVSEVVTDELLAVADSIWLIGSFTIPGKELDSTSNGSSELDVFVVVPDWETSQAATAMLSFAPDEPELPGTPDELRDEEWRGDLVKGPGQWSDSFEEVWEQIPEYVKETLRRGAKRGFFRDEEEFEARRLRYYDVFVGNRAQLDHQREMGRQPGYEDLPGIRIWESD